MFRCTLMKSDSFVNTIIIEDNTRQNRSTNYFARTMLKVMSGLLVTAATSYVCIASGLVLSICSAFVRHGFASMLALILLYGFINTSMAKNVVNNSANTSTVNAIFYFHAVLEGLTISPLVFFSTGSNVTTAFLASASLFAFLAATSLRSESTNLLSFGRMISATSFALLFIAVANIFIKSDVISVGISAVFVVICAIATVYDIQWMKMLFENCGEDKKQNDKFTTMAAMMLHSNIVNMFWHILRLLNYLSDRRKD